MTFELEMLSNNKITEIILHVSENYISYYKKKSL